VHITLPLPGLFTCLNKGPSQYAFPSFSYNIILESIIKCIFLFLEIGTGSVGLPPEGKGITLDLATFMATCLYQVRTLRTLGIFKTDPVTTTKPGIFCLVKEFREFH